MNTPNASSAIPHPDPFAAGWVKISDVGRPLDWREIFPSCEAIHLDLGAGDGGFAVGMARSAPTTGVLGIERLLGRARKIAKRAVRLHLPNLRSLRFEISYTIAFLIPPQSVDVIHIMHPDPWPKRKQQKNRLIQPAFIEACAKALKPHGELRITTDHPGYFRHILDTMDIPGWRPVLWMPDATYPRSDFESQFATQSKIVFRQKWIRTAERD